MATIIEGRGRHRVRLRDDHPLDCSVDIGHRVIRVRLPPNQWVSVPEEIYTMLQEKFLMRTPLEVPDYDSNERQPHRAGSPAMTRTETNPGYIIDGLD